MVDVRRGADKIIGVHHGRKFGQLVSGKEKIDRDSELDAYVGLVDPS